MTDRLRQRRPPVKRRRHQTKAQRELEAQAREDFKLNVLRLDFGECIGASAVGSNHRCAGPLEAHHAVRQQTIRAHISTLELTEEEIIAWLWDPANGATVCSVLHEAHTSRHRTIPFEWLPARTVDWASDRELMHLLKREHPPLFSEDG